MSDNHNNKVYFEDIICARSTPPGASALAVIRVSGKDSWKILTRIFSGARDTYESHRVYYGTIKDNGAVIDNVVVLTFGADKGFTGEESFEINCHGSEVIVSIIINLLIKEGARIAEPGEFSKRAFLNGRLDLTEAESIMDVVHASTKRSAQIAVRQLSGRLSGTINGLKEQIINLLAEVEVYIDYPEEDLTIDNERWMQNIDVITKNLNELMIGFNQGRYFREGIKAVILGKTNSGKSTLFNYLLDEDKAIVSDVHGTTRDFLDGIINIEGYGIRIYDTAGLRDTADPIEKEGTIRARGLSGDSDIIIYVISAPDGLAPDDIKNIVELSDEKKCLIILNKIDACKEDIKELTNQIIKACNPDSNKLKAETMKIVSMSALAKTGLKDFNQAFISLMIDMPGQESDDPVMTNSRHAELLDAAVGNFDNASLRLEEGFLDLCAFELRDALDRLGEITGEVTPEDVLQKIFSSFCVGK